MGKPAKFFCAIHFFGVYFRFAFYLPERFMPVGTCPLCTNTKDLVDSHFLPAASYRPQYAKGLKINEPMVVTAKRVFQSSRHITAHAFCGDCEDIFNKNGESWVMDKLATLAAFPLREMILNASPIEVEP